MFCLLLDQSDVFYKIYQKQEGAESISHKSGNDELKTYFLEILPDYDEDRVYVSDIKKILNWYNILHKYDLLVVIEKEEEGADEKDGEDSDVKEESSETKEKPSTAKEKSPEKE